MKGKLWIIASLLTLLITFAGCNSQKTTTTSTITATTPNVPTITTPDAYILIAKNMNNPSFVIIDVRTASEFDSGHITGSINLDYESTQFTSEVNKLNKNDVYLVYCATGIRGAAATQIMTSLGFKNIQNMAGGIAAWIQAGYPTVQTTTQSTTTMPTSISTPAGNGLQLRVTVNATSLTSNDTLQVNVSEYNTLSTNNNVLAEKNWGIDGLATGACPNISVLPFGVALFRGQYTAQNVSQGVPLEIFAPVVCPNYIRLITSYTFLPESINAAIMPGGDLTSPTPMSATITTNGVYTNGIQLTPMDAGLYTLVAGDEWGTIEFLGLMVI